MARFTGPEGTQRETECAVEENTAGRTKGTAPGNVLHGRLPRCLFHFLIYKMRIIPTAGSQDRLPPNILPWHIDYFQLKLLEKWPM